MTMHVETPLVKVLGNSVFFADTLGSLPMIFQPILFYPDWFFMAWPSELIFALLGNGSHPYFNGIGVGAIGWSVIWFVSGIVCAKVGASDTFTEIASIELPLLIRLPYKFIIYLLFWHIVLARIIGVLITRLTTWSHTLTVMIHRLVFILMLTPPVIYLTVSTVAIVYELIR